MNPATISALSAAVVAVIAAVTALVKVLRHTGQAASTAHAGLLPSGAPVVVPDPLASLPPTGAGPVTMTPPVITYTPGPYGTGGAGGSASTDAGSVTVSPPVNVTGSGGAGSPSTGKSP